LAKTKKVGAIGLTVRGILRMKRNHPKSKYLEFIDETPILILEVIFSVSWILFVAILGFLFSLFPNIHNFYRHLGLNLSFLIFSLMGIVQIHRRETHDFDGTPAIISGLFLFILSYGFVVVLCALIVINV
jgi:hypothetical protein